jgi:ParB family chromosome partitioning protein
MQIVRLRVDQIDPPENAHRLQMDEPALWALADSINDMGLLNPITVHLKSDGRHEIIAGHRRFVAHQILRRTEIDCIVRDAEGNSIEIERFTENLQRDDLTPMEEALAVARMTEATGADAHEIARLLRRSESWVRQRIELMQMPDDLRALTHTRDLAITTALNLARVTDDAHRAYLTNYALRSGANAGVIRQWVSEWELACARGEADSAPRPVVGDAQQPMIIQIPCYTCHTPTDHREMEIVRLCKGCAAEIRRASGA